MKYLWELASFIFILLVVLLVSKIGLLITDMLYALLSGSIVGLLFMLFHLGQSRSYTSAAASMFASLVGALIAFTLAWVFLVIFQVRIIGNAALAFDLLIGIVGASASLRFAGKLLMAI